MSLKKLSKPSKQDKAWQQKIEKQVKAEKVQLDHPKGKERFDQVIKHALTKKPKTPR
jgi:hypothetical protein